VGNKVFVFDLDDTLMWNNYNYDRAKIAFLEWLMKIFDRRVPSSTYILTLQEELDKKVGSEINPETGKQFGFTRQRFPTSFVRTYQALCDEGWGKYQPCLAQEAYDLGLIAFDRAQYRKAGLVVGAQKVLNYLAAEGHRLHLVTKGDEQIQEAKIDALNLGQSFDNIQITEGSKKDIFGSIRKFYIDSRVFSVCNSFSSDIKPALEVGCEAIFIPCYTWSAESIEVEKLPEDWQKIFWKIKKIEQILDIYPQL